MEEGEDSEGGSGEGGEREEEKLGPNVRLASVCEDNGDGQSRHVGNDSVHVAT